MLYICHVICYIVPMHVYTVSGIGRISLEYTGLQYVLLSFHKPIPGTNRVDYVFVVVPNHERFIEVRN